MKLATLFGASLHALAVTSAHAGMTCDLTDQHSNALHYSFARGSHGHTNEIVVKRNGAIISNGGPLWTRTFDPARRTMTLQQAGWTLAYEAKSHDTDTSGAALFHGANRVAAGVCVVDYSVDAPAPQPQPDIAAPTRPVGGDDVPLIPVPGEGMLVMTIVGGHSLPMLIDTGAAVAKIPLRSPTS